MKKPYTPPKKILERYADVLVNFALGGGKGIKKGDVVMLMAPEIAKPLYKELHRAILGAGGHVLHDFRPASDSDYSFEKELLINGQEHQIDFFAEKYFRGLIDQIDHTIFMLGEINMKALEGVDPKRIMRRGEAHKPYMDWRTEKENQGKFTWTLALYGTTAQAKEAKMSEQEYWNQIIKACFLDQKDPIKKWRAVYKDLDKYMDKLNKLKIDKVHVEGPDADLWIKIGEKRKWLGGSGRNIPSFEIFTSPDWRGTNGWIRLNQPLYRYGNIIQGIELEFKNGRVVKSSARKNEKVLKHMIATKNADKLGEFSMTDRRFSRITKFMAETLYDENIGGPNGNSHIALGNSYLDTYTGDPSKLSEADKKRLGYNSSSVHTDVISTAPRTVTAYYGKGKSKIIYKNGQYTL